MERVENESALIYLSGGHSTLMMNCVEKQIVGNWLEVFPIYQEIYAWDVAVIINAQLNELEHFLEVPLEDVRGP